MLSYVRDQEAKIVEFGGKVASGVLVLWSRFEGKFIGVLSHVCRTSELAESILFDSNQRLDFSAATFHNSAIPLSTVFVGDCPVNLSASI